MVEFDALSGVAILMVIGLLTFVWYTWKQDKVKNQQDKDQKQTLIFEQVQINENARPQKTWAHLCLFPLKEQYEKCVAATAKDSPPAMNILMQRTVFAIKRIYEHQHFHQEVVASKQEGLVKDEEWAEFIKAKVAIEAECAEVEKVADEAKEGFGKEIFKMANTQVQSEQKQLQEFMQKRKQELEEEKDLAIVGDAEEPDNEEDKEKKAKKVSPKNAIANRIGFWKSFEVFPLKEQFKKCAAATGITSDQSKNLLLNRTVFILKKIQEHQAATKEVVVARNNGLCKDEEWAAVVRSKQTVEAECKEIEVTAEGMQAGFGKGIFQMAQQAVMQEQQQLQQMLQRRKMMMDENEKKKAAAAASGEAVTDDLDTKKAAFWKSFATFPLKASYEAAVKKSGAASSEAKDGLVKRCVFVMKKIFEHQEISQEIIPARKVKLVSDAEWADYNKARVEVEQECKAIEIVAEKLKPGFGKQIFAMSQQIVMQEKQKMMKEMQEKKMAEHAAAQKAAPGAPKPADSPKAKKSPKSKKAE